MYCTAHNMMHVYLLCSMCTHMIVHGFNVYTHDSAWVQCVHICGHSVHLCGQCV